MAEPDGGAGADTDRSGFKAWRPASPAVSLGQAVEFLSQMPAFARRPFGDWSLVLFRQAARGHFVCFNNVDLGLVSSDWQVAKVGDFNGDGLSDILWRNTNGDTDIWQTKAAGGFGYIDAGVVATNGKIVE